MTTQSTVTQENQSVNQSTVDAEKVRRVLSVKEPSKNQDTAASQAALPKPTPR